MTIKAKLAEEMQKGREAICPGCASFEKGFCKSRLNPYTSDGKPCPYRREKEWYQETPGMEKAHFGGD